MEYNVVDGPGSTLAWRLALHNEVANGGSKMQALLARSGFTYFPCSFGKFPDGSDNIEIGGFDHGFNQHAGKHVLYCMPHTSNDDVMRSLHVLTVLLESQPASVTVLSPFVPTATMERVDKEGVVATANTTAKILSGLPSCGATVRYMFYDLHTLGHRFYFHAPAVAELHTTVNAVCAGLHDQFDLAFFPDGGALKRFGPVLEAANLWPGHVGTCEKVRSGDERIITVQGGHDVAGKNVLLIDDLVRTGGTLLQSAKALRRLGASGVSAFCVHAAGSSAELRRLETDGALDALFLTDTVEATTRALDGSAFFRVTSIVPLVHADLLRRPRSPLVVSVSGSSGGATGLAGVTAADVVDALHIVLLDCGTHAVGHVEEHLLAALHGRTNAIAGYGGVGDRDDALNAVDWTDLRDSITCAFEDFVGSAAFRARDQNHEFVQHVLCTLLAGGTGAGAGASASAGAGGGTDQCGDAASSRGEGESAAVSAAPAPLARARFLLCSESSIKLQAVSMALDAVGTANKCTVETSRCASGVSEQPLTWQETVTGCTNRLQEGMRKHEAAPYDVYIAVENGIDERTGDDVAYVLVADKHGHRAHATSTSVHMPEEAVAAAKASVASGEANVRTCAHFLLEGVWNSGKTTADPQSYLCGVGRAEIVALAIRVALGQLPR